MYDFLENVTQTESFLFCPKQSFLTISLDWPTDNVKKYFSFFMRVRYNYSSLTFTGKFSGGGGYVFRGKILVGSLLGQFIPSMFGYSLFRQSYIIW